MLNTLCTQRERRGSFDGAYTPADLPRQACSRRLSAESAKSGIIVRTTSVTKPNAHFSGFVAHAIALRIEGRKRGSRGIQARALQHLVDGITYGMVLMYIGRWVPSALLTDCTPAKCQRNKEIRARHEQGESLSCLADVFGLSAQRVSQIVQGRRK
jgi:hypothetical protein